MIIAFSMLLGFTLGTAITFLIMCWMARVDEEQRQDSLLPHLETSTFPSLKKVRASLKKSKHSQKQIEEIIKGLETLN